MEQVGGYLGVITLQMVVKIMRLDGITEGIRCIKKKKKKQCLGLRDTQQKRTWRTSEVGEGLEANSVLGTTNRKNVTPTVH